MRCFAGRSIRTSTSDLTKKCCHNAAAAWNNLANILLEQKRPGEAREAALRAIALGGPTRGAAQDTLQKIDASQPALESKPDRRPRKQRKK